MAWILLFTIVATAFANRADDSGDTQFATVGRSGLHHIKRHVKHVDPVSFLDVDQAGSTIEGTKADEKGSFSIPVEHYISAQLSADSHVFAHWSGMSKMLVVGYVGFAGLLALATLAHAGLSHIDIAKDSKGRLSILGAVTNVGGDYVQTGYKETTGGIFLMVSWVVFLIFAQVFLLMAFTAHVWKYDPLGLLHAERKYSYESLMEPFLAMLFLSAGGLALSTQLSSTFIVENFMAPCPLKDADVVLVEDHRSTRSQACRTIRQCEGSAPSFDFFCFRYIYVEEENRFRPMGIEAVTGELAHKRLNAKGLEEGAAKERHAKAGQNAINIPMPGVLVSLFQEFHTLPFIYCTCTYWLMCPINYIEYAVIGMLLSVGSGTASAYVAWRGRKKIQEMASASSEVQVMRDGVVSKLSSELLVPGDLMLVLPNRTVPCDCVLVAGEVVMSEAAITGEPMPVTKVPIEMTASVPRKTNRLLCATKVLDSTGAADGVAVAVVEAIGGATKKASLIRLVLFPEDTLREYHADLAKAYIFLVSVGVVGALCIWMLPHPLNEAKQVEHLPIFIRVLCAITDSVHPLLFVTMAAAQYVASTHLVSDGINCVASERVALAGSLDTMILDKTGTITKDSMEFHGVKVCQEDGMSEVVSQQAIEKLPSMMRFLMASCHKLSHLQDELVGNHVEIEMFRALGNWRLDFSAPEGTARTVTDGVDRLEVQRLLEFQHDRMTSGCVCKFPNGEEHVFIKGAANRIAGMCTNVPKDFLSISEDWSAKGYYVIACAWKPLGMLNADEATRDELEGGLVAGGLLIFHNELKPDSIAALEELQKGGVACKICTGDHLMTAVSVAKTTGIIQPGQRVLRLASEALTDTESQDTSLFDNNGGLYWVDIEDGAQSHDAKQMVVGAGAIMVPDESAALVVGQKEWDALRRTSLLPSVLPQIVVFARMLPESKVSVVQEFQDMGSFVGMCGDGGNDCGALRAAHVGLALSSSEASIVAHFSSGDDVSLKRLVVLLKEGRACMANNLACHLWFVAFAMGGTTMKVFLVTSSDAAAAIPAWCFYGIVFPALLPLSSMLQCRRAPTLSPCKVAWSVISPRMVTTSTGLYTIFIAQVFIGWQLLQHQPFYDRFAPIVLGFRGEDWNELSDNFESFLSFILFASFLVVTSLVLSVGGEHRMPVWKNRRLLVVALSLMVILGAVLFGENTWLHVLFHANCDSATTLAMTGRCFLGPQMEHWGDNAHQVKPGAKSVSDMVIEARANIKGGKLTCLPGLATMSAQHIPKEFQSLTAINNIYSVEFRHMLMGTIIASACLMFLFQNTIALHPWFNRLERKTRKVQRRSSLGGASEY